MGSQNGGAVEAPRFEAADVPAAMLPLLDPGYWGGHQLDSGPTEAAYYIETGDEMVNATLPLIRVAAASRRAQKAAAIFEAGQILHPADHSPGALFVLGREVLLPEDPDRPPVRMTAFQTDRPTIPPTAKELKANKFPIGQLPDRLSGGGIVYERSFFIGSTVLNSRQQPRLVLMPAAALTRDESRGINLRKGKPGQPPKLGKTLKSPKIYLQLDAGAQTHDQPIQLGETRHIKRRRQYEDEVTVQEALVRFNYARLLNGAKNGAKTKANGKK